MDSRKSGDTCYFMHVEDDPGEVTEDEDGDNHHEDHGEVVAPRVPALHPPPEIGVLSNQEKAKPNHKKIISLTYQ